MYRQIFDVHREDGDTAVRIIQELTMRKELCNFPKNRFFLVRYTGPDGLEHSSIDFLKWNEGDKHFLPAVKWEEMESFGDEYFASEADMVNSWCLAGEEDFDA